MPANVLDCHAAGGPPKEATLRKPITISLPADLSAQLDDVASTAGASRSQVVRDALRRYFSSRQLADVRAQLIPFAEARGIVTDEDVYREFGRAAE
jgi:predicted transcriptional regulator